MNLRRLSKLKPGDPVRLLISVYPYWETGKDYKFLGIVSSPDYHRHKWENKIVKIADMNDETKTTEIGYTWLE